MPEIKKLLRRVPDELIRILGHISRECKTLGFKAYMVGGTVRDMLLGVPFYDLDISVEGDAEKLAAVLESSYGYGVEFHPHFKTVTLDLPGRYSVDIATARREVYSSPAALPKVFPSDIYNDLYRRDFTINSMAVCLEGLGLVDPTNGLHDLKEGIIRVLHNNSFVDDPTRILRGIRFQQRYGFTMDKKTETLLMDAIGNGYPIMLSSDRVLTEMKLIFAQTEVIGILNRLEETGLWSALFGGSIIPDWTYKKLRRIKDACNGDKIGLMVLALLEDIPDSYLHDVFMPYSKWCERLASYRDRENSLELPVRVRILENWQLYMLFFGMDRRILDYLYATAETEWLKRNIKAYIERIKDFKFYINGSLLKVFGIKPGPLYMEILERAKREIVQQGAADKSRQIQILKKILERGEQKTWE